IGNAAPPPEADIEAVPDAQNHFGMANVIAIAAAGDDAERFEGAARKQFLNRIERHKESLIGVETLGNYDPRVMQWERSDSNREPRDYESPALTVELRSPISDFRLVVGDLQLQRVSLGADLVENVGRGGHNQKDGNDHTDRAEIFFRLEWIAFVFGR